MKPSFALNFTDDSIQLLHRGSRGWVPVGETPFSATDLDDALDFMRKTALGLEPGGFTTKLVIPNSQIRYLEVDAPGPSDDQRIAQIRTGLEGRTPYAVKDLVFDWSGKGKTVRVAVLARETLTEAEGFATTYGFSPLGFAAIPDYGDFTGEPWFGDASGAAAMLADGDTVERDKSPIRIVHREIPKPDRAAEMDDAASAVVVNRSVSAPESTPVLPAVSPPESTPASPPDSQPDAVTAASKAATDEAVAQPEAEAVAAPKAGSDPEPKEEPAAAKAMADPADAAKNGLPVDAKPEGAADAAEAPFTHVPDNPAFPEEDDTPSAMDDTDTPAPSSEPAKAAAAAGVDADLPPALPAAALMAFASRRGADAPTRAPTLGAASRPDQAALARAARGKPVEDLPPMPRPPQAGARPATTASGGLRGGVAKGLGGLVSASSVLPGSRKAKVKPGPLPPPPNLAPRGGGAVAAPAAGPADAAKSLTRPGGTFGSQPTPRPRSRAVLFLTLLAVLMLCLALIAAWSSYYLASNRATDGTATATAPQATEDGSGASVDVAADLPAVEDEMLADGEGALLDEPASDSADLASDLPADLPAELPAELEAAPEETAVPAADPAPDTAVSSDSPASQPLSETQDEIFLATSDTPPPALDALSLPAPEAAADGLPEPQMPPPPFGTVYAFDENGLLLPTPEGIVSPEGVMLIAGAPPVLPPSRSAAATEAAAAAAAAVVPPTDAVATVLAEPVDTTPAAVELPPAEQPNPDLADRRPRTRPEGLVPNPDDAALATEPEVRFTSLRPRLRPQAILAAGEQARQETSAASLVSAEPAPDPAIPEQAEADLAAAAAAEAANPSVVAISRRPAARPRDFSRAVEAAVAAAIRAPDPVPEAEPEKVAKKEPAPDIKPEEQSEIDEPEVVASAAPKIPTKASVAKQATYVNALNLSKTNLIGVYGTPSKRYALIRQSNGKYKKVKVGDKIDGGRIEAITQTEVRYKKGGRLIALKMPKG